MSLKVARQRGKLPRDVMEESAPRDSFTIKQMIDLYIENLRRIRKKKGADEVARFMTNVVHPYGSFDVDDFGAREAKAVVTNQVQKGNRVQAGRIASE